MLGIETPPRPAQPSDTRQPSPRISRRRLGALFALLGTVAAVLVPLLPVHQDVVTVNWPTQQYGTRAVQAPLSGYQPIWLRADIPCQSVRDLAQRRGPDATLVSTTPPGSDDGSLVGLTVRLTGGQLAVYEHGTNRVRTAVPAGDCTIALRSDATATTVTAGGRRLLDLPGDHRPLFTGIYSDLDAQRDDTAGLAVSARVDNRFNNSATLLKLLAMIAAVGAAGLSFVLLRRVDGHRATPGTPWWRRPPHRLDVAVFAVLAVWALVGPITSDDGYTLSMVRARWETGYVGNYFRWFNTPEQPFGWFYDFYALWAQVSTSTLWMRVPSVLMGVCTWVLLRKFLLPLLGRRVVHSRTAIFSAGAAFTAFWLGYDHGLRPESPVVLFTALGIVSFERALATRRLLPLSVALLGGGLAVAATPTGLIALLPFVVGFVPLVRLLAERARELGWLTTLAPLLSTGTAVLVLVFYNQTVMALLEGAESRTQLGPSEGIDEEPFRYATLFSTTPDGSFARRFPMVLLVLCMIVIPVVLAVRKRVPGVSAPVAWRILGVGWLGPVAIALTPTKWTHHFGAFAAIGGALAGLAAALMAPIVMRWPHRALFCSLLLGSAGAAALGPNNWWYLSAWDVTPPVAHVPALADGRVADVLFAGAAVFAVLAIVGYVLAWRGAHASPQEGSATRRMAVLTGAPITLLCLGVIAVELATFVKVTITRWDTYSLGGDVVRTAFGQPGCGLSDAVQVENDPLGDVLRPEPGSAPSLRGFHIGGLPSVNADGEQIDTEPPFGFGTAQYPVWNSYGTTREAEFRSAWYGMPRQAIGGDVPLVIAVAGAKYGDNPVLVQFARRTANGYDILGEEPAPQTELDRWRDARVELDEPWMRGADVVRVVAKDGDGGPVRAGARGENANDWIAVTPPRLPRVRSMTEQVGGAPVFAHWPGALVYPCLRPFTVREGVAEVPGYMIATGTRTRGMGYGQSAAEGGGPLGWLNSVAKVRELPGYVRGDLELDWGNIYQVQPYATDTAPASAALRATQQTRWGWYSPGPMSRPERMPALPVGAHD